MASANLTDIAILNSEGSDYCCIISLISKNETINLLKNVALIEKVKHYKLKKNIKILKSYTKIEKTIIKFGDIQIRKQKFHQHKEPIVIKNIEIDKIVVLNKVPFGKKDLNILLVTKMLKKLNFYVYFSHKCLHIELILMKLNINLFRQKMTNY